jgi:hypothetical protein
MLAIVAKDMAHENQKVVRVERLLTQLEVLGIQYPEE